MQLLEFGGDFENAEANSRRLRSEAGLDRGATLEGSLPIAGGAGLFLWILVIVQPPC